MANHVVIDPAAIEAMLSDWSSPVGQVIEQYTERLDGLAHAAAPVSPTGSRYAPPGFLRSRVHIARQHDADGHVLGMVGVGVNSRGNRYPLMFVANAKGFTENPGHRSRRSAVNYFLMRALRALAGA